MRNQKSFKKFISRLKPAGADISIYIINLKDGDVFEYNPDKFIYPASTYKIFIAAEVLRQIEIGKLNFSDTIKIKSPNDMDNESKFYPTDVFPVLHAGDSISIDNLIKLMLQRSDNTASNTLIDLVSRESISENIIKPNNWHGSDVTRKFLNRTFESEKYKYSDITLSCGRHLAEFMRKLYNDELISPFVSKNMKHYMHGILNINNKKADSKLKHHKKNLNDTIYEKTGWIQATSKKSLNLLKHRYQSQAAIVKINNEFFSIGALSKYKTVFPWKYFKLSKITNWLKK